MNYLTLEQIQHEELNLLIALTTFLEENGLKYSLHSGTLLGAVRHGGFIPWDDDVDISMPRPDYERFLSRCAELPNNLFVINSDNSEFPYRFTKVCTRDVRAQQDVYENVFEEYLWVDVFPIDGLPASEEEQTRLFKSVLLNKRLANYCVFNHKTAHSRFGKIIAYCYRVLPGRKTRRDRLNAKFKRLIESYPFESSEFMTTTLSSDSNHLWVWRKDDYCDWGRIDFCGHSFMVYSNPEKLLTHCYKDYMQLPPKEERRTHEMKCWRVNSN